MSPEIPEKPFFDKKRLLSSEFERYRIKVSKQYDLNLAGYKKAIEGIIVGTEIKDVKIVPFIANVQKDLLNENVEKTRTNVWACVVVSVKTVNGEVYESCGDANLLELEDRSTTRFLVRIAESRARKRAYAQALGITPEDFIADMTRKSHMDDIDTPLAGGEDEEESGKGAHQEKPKEKVSLDDLTSE